MKRARTFAALVVIVGIGAAGCGGGSDVPARTVALGAVPAPSQAQTGTTAAPETPKSKTTAATKTTAAARRQTGTTSSASRARRSRSRRTWVPKPPPAPRPTAQSKAVLACLSGAGLHPVAAASATLWSGYAAATGGMVYVSRYETDAAAARAAKFLSDEEVGVVAHYLVRSPTARGASYSAVPAVATCLRTGRPTKPTPGKRQKPRFVF
jgi:hypothetical protein